MSNLIQCPSCKENIENDSSFCDQCGEAILFCSSCGRPGKGKRCIFDGKEMVPAGSAPQPSAGGQPQLPSQQPPSSQPQPPPQPSAPQAAQQPPPPAGDKLKLSGQGINIEVSSGDILGRSKGPHAGILGRFSHISGTHCRFIKTASGWSVEDMGSTNGTFYNNSRITPNTPVAIQNNSTVKLADIAVTVSFGGGGGEGTVRI